jgi:hypothetical protein
LVPIRLNRQRDKLYVKPDCKNNLIIYLLDMRKSATLRIEDTSEFLKPFITIIGIMNLFE